MSIRIRTSPKLLALALVSTLALCMATPSADAQRRGGGGGRAHAGAARASAPTSVNRSAMHGSRGGANRASAGARPAGGNRASAGTRPAGGRDINRDGNRAANRDVNRNTNRNTNINNNTNINRDIDIDVDNGHWNDWDDHPFATAAAVTAGVALTSAVIGSIVYSVPPSCSTVIVNGISYSQCGNTWYQPQYYGTTVQYVVVNPP